MSHLATATFRPFATRVAQISIALALLLATVTLLTPNIHRLEPGMPREWMRPVVQMSTLAIATLGSEDLTCITAGELVRGEKLSWTVAIVGCTAGIYFGDLGLWLLGRLTFGGARRMPWLSRQLPVESLKKCETWFDRRGGVAIVAARFLPGFRLPMYLAAGAIGRRPWQFAGWSLVAAMVWTPALVIATAIFGHALVQIFGRTWLTALAAVLVMYGLLRLVAQVFTEIGRLRLAASIARIWRWEFWPAWFFYLPVAVYIVYLSIRHRGFNVITAANPGIPQGGFVGESKFEILRRLDPSHVIPFELIASADPIRRIRQLEEVMRHRGWNFPIILKPDVGERGASVRRIHTVSQASEYLKDHDRDVLAQPFHPGPHEAGVFYIRLPQDSRGRIFSITDKVFSALVGDGVSTLEELIWRHPRYRMQARTFLKRHATHRDRVLLDGERFSLAMAGNHCQGTMFCDGAHLITPQLEAEIDRIARSYDGFFIGRFDVRYADVDAFKSGRDFGIVELNGVTAESSNIYDPRGSLWHAYRTMFAQWRILFAIGEANIAAGHQRATLRELASLAVGHYANRSRDSLAD